jgi:aryl-alcohol dehydrogenase-like predicted oxidoreductase
VITESDAASIPNVGYRFYRDEPGTHVILPGTGSIEHMHANLASIVSPPLPESITNRWKTIFRRVDPFSGQ